MGALPVARDVLVGFGHGGVDVDGAEDLVQANPMFHGQHVLGDQVAGVFADDRDAKDAVFARHGQHLDKAMGFAVGDGAVEVVNVVNRDFVRNFFLLRLLLVQADPRHLGLDEGGPGNHPVVGAKLPERIEQRIHRRVPCLVRCRMRKLIGACYIAGGVDVRKRGLQVAVHLHRALGGHVQLLEAKAFQVRLAAHRYQQRVKSDSDLAAVVQSHKDILAIDHFDAMGCVREAQVDAFGKEPPGDETGGILVLARQQARAHLDLRDAASEPREDLGQLAADRPAAQHHHAAGTLAQGPDVLGCEIVNQVKAGQGGHEWAATGRNHDAARGQQLLLPIVLSDLHLPRRDDPCATKHHINAQRGVAID